MASSEIRVNTIKSRAGLGTWSISDYGLTCAGIITATSFVGDGSALSGVSAGATVADDTSTNSTFYPLFTSTTSGTVTESKVSTTKLSFNPSTGALTATSFSGDGSNLTGIDATALKDSGGSVKVQANTSGAVVTGILTATSFSGDGGSLTGIQLTVNSQTSSYTLVAGDVGKLISITTGGVTVDENIFSAGQSIVIYNDSSSSQTITQGTNVTLRLAGTADTGNVTLQQRGLASVLCVASNEFVLTGTGII